MSSEAETQRSSGAVDELNPWPGLASFRERDRRFFRGRETEATALVRLLDRARLTTLYGVSGLGKTSLLAAGVFPLLRDRDVLPVPVRLEFSEGAPPLATQVRNAVLRAAGEAAPPQGPIEPPESFAAEQTLWEAFHRRDADFWSARHHVVVPLLVFDQFEEVFTLGRSDVQRAVATHEFLVQLADLVEGRVPEQLKRRFDTDPKAAGEFAFGRHPYKVLLSLREDYLAEFETLRPGMPLLAHNRYRLRRLNGEAALVIVTQVPAIIDDTVAEKVVRFVAAESENRPLRELTVEPALLSVVCRELNLRRLRRGEPRITTDLLSGSHGAILRDFYERSVADLPAEVRTYLEEDLLTVSGYRDSKALENALSVPGITTESIDTLVDRRLLRKEERAGVERIELTHDLLTGVVAASRDRRRQEEHAEEDRQARLEAEAREAEARKEVRRWRMVGAAIVMLAIAATITAVLAYNFREGGLAAQAAADAAQRSAAQANATAAASLQAAEAAQRAAEDAESRATTARQEADENLQLADRAQSNADAAQERADKAQQAADDNLAQARAAQAAAADANAEAGRQQGIANENTAIANDALAEAERQRDDAAKLHRLAIAQSMAAKVALLPVESADTAALLASLAFQLNLDPLNEYGDPETAEIHRALRTALRMTRATRDPGGTQTSAADVIAQSAAVRAVEVAPVTGDIAFGTEDGAVFLVRVDDVTATLDGDAAPVPLALFDSPVRDLAFDRQGRRLAAGLLDGTVHVWNLQGDPVAAPLLASSVAGTIAALEFDPAAERLLVGTRTRAGGGEIHVWTEADGIRRVAETQSALRRFVGAAQSRTLLAATGSELYEITDSARPVPGNPCAGRDVRALAINGAGDQLACGDAQGQIRIARRQGDTWRPFADLTGHVEGSPITALDFNFDSTRLASAGMDSEVHLWNVDEPAAAPVELSGHDLWVWDIAFSADGRQLWSGSEDRTLSVAITRSDELARRLCELIDLRNLGPEEWQVHVPNFDPEDLDFDGAGLDFELCPQVAVGSGR